MTEHRPVRLARRRAIGSTVAVVALLAACGNDSDDEAATTTSPLVEIQISDAWARTSPAVASAGAVYMTISNAGPAGDSLRSAEVDEIIVPGEGAIVLEPGGHHIMLLDLAMPLEVGSTITLMLTFEGAGTIEVVADVRDTAP